MKLNKEEKKEMKDLAKSASLRRDMELLSQRRHNPFEATGEIDIDKFLLFLNQYNEFIGHSQKTFCRIIDKDMRL